MLAIIGILVYLAAVSAAVTRASGQPRTVTEPGIGVANLPMNPLSPVGDAGDGGNHRSPGSVTVPLYHGKSARFWNAKYVRMRHLAYVRRGQTRKLRRVLLASPSVTEAINLAGATYGHTDTLHRKARCESGLNPNAKNGSEASGLFQFLPSTWATTPYARFSIWSPYANAMAAGWMHSVGRGNEWSCK